MALRELFSYPPIVLCTTSACALTILLSKIAVLFFYRGLRLQIYRRAGLTSTRTVYVYMFCFQQWVLVTKSFYIKS